MLLQMFQAANKLNPLSELAQWADKINHLGCERAKENEDEPTGFKLCLQEICQNFLREPADDKYQWLISSDWDAIALAAHSTWTTTAFTSLPSNRSKSWG